MVADGPQFWSDVKTQAERMDQSPGDHEENFCRGLEKGRYLIEYESAYATVFEAYAIFQSRRQRG